MFYSLIIPVFNRPDDMEDILSCLAEQTYKEFEVIVVESGSSIKSDHVVDDFKDKLNIRYYYKSNEGQGFSRNYGMERAEGDYFVILDSDLKLDSDYLENLNKSLQKNSLDSFGGPDRAHPSFTNIQKAVDFILTSGITTGGIRGNVKHIGKFYPRSFNMGFSRQVYEKTKGFKLPYFGEDLELSRRINSLGFTSGLVPEAYVYHKRKNSFSGFFKQMFFFGRARINVYKIFPDTLKLAHFFPAFFVFYSTFATVAILVNVRLGLILWLPLLLYLFIIFLGAYTRHKSLKIGLFSIPAVFVQMYGYGLGFTRDFWRRVILRSDYSILNNE